MPRPTPDYLPAEVVEKAAALGLRPKEFAVRKGLSPNRFYSFFGNPHTKLRPYLILCQAGNVTLDELVIILKNAEFGNYVDKMMQMQSVSSIPTLAKKIGVSYEFIYDRIKKPGLNGLASYLEVARALDLNLEELASICTR